MNPNPQPPASEYEKEIRALYRERNEKAFTKSPQPGHSGHKWIDFISLLILIAVVGLAASVAVYYWLLPVSPSAISQRSVHTTIAQPELSDDFVKQLTGATATVFALRQVKAGAALVDQSYLTNEALGQALVLSSDGWLVTTQLVVGEASGDYVVVPADGKVYPVEIVALDPVAPLTYLKIAARNLTATPFALTTDVAINDPVVVISNESQGVDRSWYLRYLANLSSRTAFTNRADLVVASESLPDRYLLDQALPSSGKGAPVINLQGKVVGLVADYGGQLRGVVPLVNMTAVIDKLFSEQKTVRPVLGVNYLQASWLITADSQVGNGAILATQARRPAVIANSAADKAGLKEGDRIIALDNERLTNLSLSAALQRFRPGSPVEIIIERSGKEEKINVTLGEIEGEAYDSTAEE